MGPAQKAVVPLHEEGADMKVEFGNLVGVPGATSKTLYFVRHGEGFHNAAAAAADGDYHQFTQLHLDAHLNEKGWEQAHGLRKHLRAAGVKPELVVVSPMSRAMETAVGAFGGSVMPNQDPECNRGVLMRAQTSVEGERTEHAAVSCEDCPPFVACELAREVLGIHMCDKRRPTALYRERFPGINFEHVVNEEDLYWHPVDRESREELIARGQQLLRWLMSRPESKIAIVSHSTILHHTMLSFPFPSLHERFLNCELRTVTVADKTVADTHGNSHDHAPATVYL